MSLFKTKTALQRCIDEDRDDSKLLSDLHTQRDETITEMRRLKAIVEKIDANIRILQKRGVELEVRAPLVSETISPLLRYRDPDAARLPQMRQAAAPARKSNATPVKVRCCGICGLPGHIATNQKFHPL